MDERQHISLVGDVREGPHHGVLRAAALIYHHHNPLLPRLPHLAPPHLRALPPPLPAPSLRAPHRLGRGGGFVPRLRARRAAVDAQLPQKGVAIAHAIHLSRIHSCFGVRG